ncbi:MAG: hypothetical protein RSE56_01845 [Bacilli bacterium]
MKKPIIFSIIVIFILSVVIVGILGVKMGSGEEIIYVTKITCTNLILGADTIPALPTTVENTFQSVVEYEKNIKFALNYQVAPDNATYKGAAFTSSNENWYTINDFGIVSFTEEFHENIASKGTITKILIKPTITSTDGHAIKATYNVVVKF